MITDSWSEWSANGRTCGDLAGQYTCCRWNGMSAVDLLVVVRDLFHRINYFSVDSFDWFSDHALISFSLRVQMKNEIIILKSWKRITKSFQDWNYDNKFKFKKALVSDEIQSLRSDFSRTAYDNVNEATDKLTEIIQLALQRVLPKRHHKNVPPKCQRHTKR